MAKKSLIYVFSFFGEKTQEFWTLIVVENDVFARPKMPCLECPKIPPLVFFYIGFFMFLSLFSFWRYHVALGGKQLN